MSSERNYGIDLLKIVSMFMVVILHILGHGGVLESALDLTINDTVAWLIKILCMCAVNLFALTTGYLCIDRKFKYKNTFNLWVLTFFYSVLFTLIFKGLNLIGIIKAMFPVSNNVWWYFSAYFCFILFTPFINNYLNSTKESDHRKLIYVILFIMCIIGLISRVFGSDVVNVDMGYSPIWLMSLYIIGAYVKRYDFKLKNRSKILYILIYFLSTLIALLSRILIIRVPILSQYFNNSFLIEYNSFPIVINSFALFLLFLKINVKECFKKPLSFLAGLSFSVYLIHFHKSMRNVMINNLYVHFVGMPVYQMVFMILFTAVVIYVVCTTIDVIRYYLFKFLRVEKLGCWVDEKIVSLLTKKG